jgi:hypothetical protein
MSGNGSMFSEFKAGAVLPSTVTTATSGGPELNAMKSAALPPMTGGKKSKRSKKSRRAKHARKTHKKTRNNKHHRK